MMELALAPCNDSSSTESEYYVDSLDEAEEEEDVLTSVHEYKARVRPKPLDTSQPRQNQDHGAYNTNTWSELNKGKEIFLPQGSEWSHGVTSAVFDTAVERALAMARELRKATPRDETLTTDTTNSNASPIEKKKTTTIESKEKKMAIVKKRKGVETKADRVLQKRAKVTASPGLVTKPMTGGLQQSLNNVVEESREMEKGRAVSQSQWNSTESQTSFKTKEIVIGTLSPQKQSGHRETKLEMVASDQRIERSNSVASRRKFHSRSPSTGQSKCINSPTNCPVEQESRTQGDTLPVVHYARRSPVIHYSRKSHSRSPPSRRVEERRTGLRSRSSCQALTVPSSRSCSLRVGDYVSSRQHHDYEKRPSHAHGRPQSPLRPSWSVQPTRMDRPRHDRYEPRYIRYDSHVRRSSQQPSGEKSTDRRSLSHRTSARISHGFQETNRETFQPRDRDYHRSRSIHDREKLIVPQRDGRKLGSRTMEETGMPIIGQTTSHVLPVTAALTHTNRSPAAPVNASAVFSRHVVRHDEFERQVFKLKLREADVDEMMAAGPDDECNWLCDNRKRACAEERARLMAQDLKRFETVYASVNVTPLHLKRYQSDRDFGWRVAQYKRRQTVLQEQSDVSMSLETKAELWRKLDEEREQLIAENAVLFHKVITSRDRTSRQRTRSVFAGSANISQSSGQRALGTNVHQEQPNLKLWASVTPTDASRVVVGAALQLQGDNARRASYMAQHHT